MRNRRITQIALMALALMGLLWVGAIAVYAEVPPTPTPTPEEIPPPEGWDKSSLYFDEGYGCQGSCEAVSAQVCNEQSSKDMTGSTTWELYWAASGNPKDGTVIASGTVEPLQAGQCLTLSHTPDDSSDDASGNYKFKVYQPAGHPGQGELWSESCEITCQVPPTEPPEPEGAHPVGQALAAFFDVLYEEVIGWHEEGIGFGNIAKAYFLADELEDVTVEDVLLEKLAGTGWGKIMKALGLHPSSKGKNLGQVMSGHGDAEEPEDLTATGDDHPGQGHGPPKRNNDKTPPGQAKEDKGKGKGK